MTYADNMVYHGHWKEGSRDGKCTITFPDGGHFQGSVVKDKRCGHGDMQFKDGNVYIGNYKDVNKMVWV